MAIYRLRRKNFALNLPDSATIKHELTTGEMGFFNTMGKGVSTKMAGGFAALNVGMAGLDEAMHNKSFKQKEGEIAQSLGAQRDITKQLNKIADND